MADRKPSKPKKPKTARWQRLAIMDKEIVDVEGAATLLGIDEETAKVFARERGRLRAAGQLIGDADLFIAATALQQGATLLTNNRRHFERVTGLRMESI